MFVNYLFDKCIECKCSKIESFQHLLNVLLVDIENLLKKGEKRARDINFAQGPPNSNPALCMCPRKIRNFSLSIMMRDTFKLRNFSGRGGSCLFRLGGI